MTEYARIENEAIVESRNQLPRNYILPGGTKISNFHNSDENVIKDAGWLPITNDDKPSFNSEKEHIVANPFSEWKIRENDVLRTWKVEEKQFVPDVQDFLGAVRQKIGKQIIRELGRKYSDLITGLQMGTQEGLSVAQEGVDDALSNGDITPKQYDAIIELAQNYHIPLEKNDS